MSLNFLSSHLTTSPKKSPRRINIIIRGNAHRDIYCQSIGLTYRGQSLSTYLCHVLIQGVTEAVQHYRMDVEAVESILQIAYRVESQTAEAISDVLSRVRSRVHSDIVVHMAEIFPSIIAQVFSSILGSAGAEGSINIPVHLELVGIPAPEMEEHAYVAEITPDMIHTSSSDARMARIFGIERKEIEQIRRNATRKVRAAVAEKPVFAEALSRLA